MTDLVDDELESVVAVLRDPSMATPAIDFPVGQPDVDQPGLYAWTIDADGNAVLAGVFELVLPELIYAGQAGATSRSGVERAATLRSRIARNHLNGNIGSSTFRRTLTAVLFEPLGLRLERPGKLDRHSSDVISDWMRAHLRITTVACVDRSTLAALEHAMLTRLDPPFNLMGMPPSAVRTHLKVLRRRIS